MRQELQDAIASASRSLGQPGVWWTGAERLKIARETRRARSCALCPRRKEALSPHSLIGSHDCVTDLPPPAIEAVHRIVSDPGRLSETWYRGLIGVELVDEAYVELLSVVAITTAFDTFDRATGAASRDLPQPSPGTPTRRR